MFPKIALVRQGIESLYDSLCKIYRYEKKVDEATHETVTEPVLLVAEPVPCRVDISTSDMPPATYSGAEPGAMQQVITLFLKPEIAIPPGCFIEVTGPNGSNTYEASGKPVVYTHHQEVRLRLKEARP